METRKRQFDYKFCFDSKLPPELKKKRGSVVPDLVLSESEYGVSRILAKRDRVLRRGQAEGAVSNQDGGVLETPPAQDMSGADMRLYLNKYAGSSTQAVGLKHLEKEYTKHFGTNEDPDPDPPEPQPEPVAEPVVSHIKRTKKQRKK